MKAKKNRLRNKALHVSLTQEERNDFDAACKAHGLLEREMVMHAVRAYGTLLSRVEALETQVAVLARAVEEAR